jgi:hypothetical protein
MTHRTGYRVAILALLLVSMAAAQPLEIDTASRLPAKDRPEDITFESRSYGRGLGSLTWKLPDALAEGLYWVEFSGSAPDNPVEWISECEFEPYRMHLRRGQEKDFTVQAFSFVVPDAPVRVVEAYRHGALEVPYRMTTRRSDRPVHLKPGDSLRLDCRWKWALLGDVRLVSARPGIDTADVSVEVPARYGLFDTREPIRLGVSLQNVGARPLRPTVSLQVIDAVAGAVPGSEQRAQLPELAPGTSGRIDLTPQLPFGAYTLHVRLLDDAGAVLTHLQRHFTYSPYIDARNLPDDWPLGFHHRGESLLPPVGFKTMRVFTGWEQMQPKDGPYDWSQMDRIVEYCRANGHKILWVCNGLPRWASSRPDAQNSPQGDVQPFWAYAPKDWQLFENLVRAFWERYAPDGKLDVVTSIEVLNEPNVRHARGLGFDGYYKTSEIVHRVTREMAPGATVVGISESGGIHTWWVEGVLKTGAGKFYDAVSAHGYEINTPVGPVSHEARFGRLRKLLDQYGLPEVQMWDTETGVGSWGRWGGQVVSDLEMEKRARASSKFDPRSPGKVGRSWRSSNEFVSSGWMVRSATQKLTLGVKQIHWFKWRAHEISWVHDYDAGGNPVPKLMNPVHAILSEMMMRYGYIPSANQPKLASPDKRFQLLAHRFEGPQGALTVIYAHPKTGGFVVEDETAAKATAELGARVGEPVIPAETGRELASLPTFSAKLFEVAVPGVADNAVTMDILARRQSPLTRRDGNAVINVSQEPIYLIEPANGQPAYQPK